MTKRQVILSAVVAALLSVSSIAVAVEFGPDSANITHRYLPVETGAWQIKLGAGNWTGRVMYTHAVGIDTVSGAQIGAQTFNDVKCLKVNLIHTELNGTDEFDTIWFAQDTEGNVWLLKIYLPIDDTTYTLGCSGYRRTSGGNDPGNSKRLLRNRGCKHFGGHQLRQLCQLH